MSETFQILYAAVARRLDYPVKLVLAKEHVFCRWEGNGEKLNIEGAGQGMNTFPDDYYRKWPKPITDAEVARGEYLKSLSASEELALFLRTRADCLVDIARPQEAVLLYREALVRMPQSTNVAENLKIAELLVAGKLAKASDGSYKAPVRPAYREPATVQRLRTLGMEGPRIPSVHPFEAKPRPIGGVNPKGG